MWRNKEISYPEGSKQAEGKGLMIVRAGNDFCTGIFSAVSSAVTAMDDLKTGSRDQGNDSLFYTD